MCDIMMTSNFAKRNRVMNMLRIVPLIGLMLSLANPGRTQEWVLAFERGLLTPWIVHAAADGGFLMGGGRVLVKLTPEGRVAWQSEYKGTDFYLWDILGIQPTAEGGYVAAGQAGYRYPDAVVFKLSGTGQVEWARIYDAWDWFGTASIRQTPDSGFIYS